jgi:predicted nucleotide-binding protein
MRKDLVYPRFEILYSDLDELGIGHFLESREFKKLLISENLESIWRNFLEKVRNERTYVIAGHDHNYGDNLSVFIHFLNMIEESEKVLNFILLLISKFILSFKTKKDFSFLKDDFELLNISRISLEEINNSISKNNLLESEIPKKESSPREETVIDDKKNIFIVHGHDNALKAEVALFLSKLNLNPLILNDLPLHGETIIEKIEKYSNVDYAIALMTPDDLGKSKTQKKYMKRARQNVILELGYFISKLGRDNVAIICEKDIELPSDINGILYIVNSENSWQLKIAKELESRGFDIDFNLFKYSVK